jgi:hypothetical protein
VELFFSQTEIQSEIYSKKFYNICPCPEGGVAILHFLAGVNFLALLVFFELRPIVLKIKI